MHKLYGVGITNRYSCFIDNEDLDPLEQLKISEADRETKKKAKETSEKIVTGPAQAGRKGIRDSNAKGNANVKDNKGNENVDRRPPRADRGPKDRVPEKPQADRPQGDRSMRFNNEEGREARNNRCNQDDTNRDVGDFEGRGRGGYFRDRGGRGGSGYARGSRGGQRKREFDRQSGSDKSGVKAVDKRDGAGSRNWGTYKDELEVTTGDVANDSLEEKPEGVEGAGEGRPDEDTENIGDTVPTEDQPKQMTLDEWKALQQPRAKPVFNLRKAGEGEDSAQWNKMILKKKEKEQAEGDEEEDEEEYDCPQRAGRQRQILDVNFHFADSRRGGERGFGGPGRGRGAGRGSLERGRGGFERDRGERERPADRPGGERGSRGGFRNFSRGGRGSFSREDRSPRQPAPKVDDDNDFPALLG